MSKTNNAKKKPCSHCPFRKDKPFHLGSDKVKAIVESINQDAPFHCHETIDYGENGSHSTTSSRLCVGSAIFLEQTRSGGMLANLSYRCAAMFGELTPDRLSADIPVYDSLEAMLEGTTLLNFLRHAAESTQEP